LKEIPVWGRQASHFFWQEKEENKLLKTTSGEANNALILTVSRSK
jgi:hypothetical protein